MLAINDTEYCACGQYLKINEANTRKIYFWYEQLKS